MVTKEEQKLIDGCIQGKTESQKQLFLEYGPLVKGICQRYAASPEEGEDMFHDVFVFILTHFKDYNKITSLKGWIYRIAINKAVDHYRKSRAAKFTPIENEEFVVSAPQTPIPEVLTMDQLVAFINELPDRQRTAAGGGWKDDRRDAQQRAHSGLPSQEAPANTHSELPQPRGV